jgi:hypothetical protein
MEQEIIEEPPVENIFKRSLEVIQEQSMEINEERDDRGDRGGQKIDSSPEVDYPQHRRKLFSRNENDLMNLLHASI